MLYCEVNGKTVNYLPVNDRGLAYGDGAFTTAKINAGSIVMIEEHLERLETSCKTLQIVPPNISQLREHLSALALSYEKAVIKIMLTAGSGGRGYSRQGISQTTTIITINDFPSHYENWAEEGIALGVSAFKLAISENLAGLKHLNRLEQVMIRQELDNKNSSNKKYDDLIALNYTENVIETSCANLFWLKDNQLYTPELQLSGVAGLMRNAILSQYPNTLIAQYSLNDVNSADAIFICNTVMGVVPVKSLNNKNYSVTPIRTIQAELLKAASLNVNALKKQPNKSNKTEGDS